MSKPDWKDAPEWANYLAMDADKLWFWYENKPSVFNQSADWVKGGRTQHARFRGSWSWRDTLEERPK